MRWLLVLVGSMTVLVGCGGERAVVSTDSAPAETIADTSAPVTSQPEPGSSTDPSATGAAVDPAGCAHVIAVEIEHQGDGEYAVTATVRSSDTGTDKYADLWEVRAPDGTVLGTRVLAHPHVDEQPFTRSLGGVEIPGGVEAVEVVARDSVEGFCGETVTADVPG